MHLSWLASFAPFALAASSPAEAPHLVESVVPALEVDDACAGAADCEVSFRQLRGEATAAASGAAARDAQEALALSSTFSEGVDYQASRQCDVKELDRTGAAISSSFSRSRDGVAWHSKTLVLSVDAQPPLFEEIHPEWALALRLVLDFTPGLNTTIVIGGLKDFVPSSLSAESPHCQMVRPGCFGKEHCYATQPPKGWARSSEDVITQPASSIISVNVTDLVDSKLGSVQVWAVPAELSEDGQWKTPEIKVTNWRFFNLAGSGGDFDGEEEEYW